jgi:hypothetical protein
MSAGLPHDETARPSEYRNQHKEVVMRSKGIWACALLTCALIGCTEQQLPTADVSEAAFNFMNNPKDGPVVYRYDQGFWWVTTDPARGRLAVHGEDVTDDIYCGGSSGWDTVAIQRVYPPHEEFLKQFAHANDQYVAVYAATSGCDIWGCPFDVDMWCENATGPLLIAQGGGVDFRYQLTSGKTFSWTFNGFITDWVNGGTLKYSEHQNAVWKDGGWVWKNEDITLTPVPGR